MYQTDSLNNAFQVDYTQLVSNRDFMQNQSFKEEMFNFNVRPRYLGFEYDEFDDFGRVEKTKSFMVYASLVYAFQRPIHQPFFSLQPVILQSGWMVKEKICG